MRAFLPILVALLTLSGCSHHDVSSLAPQDWNFYRIAYRRTYTTTESAESRTGKISVKVTVLSGQNGETLTLKTFLTASPEVALELLDEEVQGIKSLHDNERDPYFADASAAPGRALPTMDSSFTSTPKGPRYSFLWRGTSRPGYREARRILITILIQCGSGMVRLEKLVPEKAWDQRDQDEADSFACA